ncbi:glucose-1-phosphate cytidylyltransferase [Desulfopila sp. IMCC35008]|uniref:glucose-1-phosphate cytidylyltransferase n=1 Tax=Desulfopila sp. IMCC35008 TaxID=2653858 RepID=UPI0013D74A3D|nr:glucose-1-phosphate cytidylyltransferase [Desulfopila sp. IMCC35008]
MKVVILAGGYGTRLSEETGVIPKPMVEIGGKPILWHIMKIYSFYGYNEFVVLTGYKSHVIKDYFVNYYNRYSDITVDMTNNTVSLHKTHTEPWRVTMLYTGQDTMTGGRLKKAQRHLEDEPFFLTYGDGVADVNISALVDFHNKSSAIATLTSVQPVGRFGVLDISKDNKVKSFVEKPAEGGTWVNGGFFVLEPEVFNYIGDHDETVSFEEEPLTQLASSGNLNAYKHEGFWKPMDNLRDKNELTKMWVNGVAPWKIW